MDCRRHHKSQTPALLILSGCCPTKRISEQLCPVCVSMFVQRSIGTCIHMPVSKFYSSVSLRFLILNIRTAHWVGSFPKLRETSNLTRGAASPSSPSYRAFLIRAGSSSAKPASPLHQTIYATRLSSDPLPTCPRPFPSLLPPLSFLSFPTPVTPSTSFQSLVLPTQRR